MTLHDIISTNSPSFQLKRKKYVVTARHILTFFFHRTQEELGADDIQGGQTRAFGTIFDLREQLWHSQHRTQQILILTRKHKTQPYCYRMCCLTTGRRKLKGLTSSWKTTAVNLDVVLSGPKKPATVKYWEKLLSHYSCRSYKDVYI